MAEHEIWILAFFYAAFNLGGLAVHFIIFLRMIFAILRLNPAAISKAQVLINRFVPRVLGFIFVLILNLIAVFWGFVLLPSKTVTIAGAVSLFLIIYLVSISILSLVAIVGEILFYLAFKPILGMKNRALEAVVYSPVRQFILNSPIGRLLKVSGE